jgi:hypothetical protein
MIKYRLGLEVNNTLLDKGMRYVCSLFIVVDADVFFYQHQFVSHFYTFNNNNNNNKQFENKGEDEYGIKGGIEPRFHRNADCRNAYKNYFCWINFPRCDKQEQSLMTCRSSCENFFRVCGYEQDLWRCGHTKLFNGYEPEVLLKRLKRSVECF